jgi:ferredoxin-2, mitochondrial
MVGLQWVKLGVQCLSKPIRYSTRLSRRLHRLHQTVSMSTNKINMKFIEGKNGDIIEVSGEVGKRVLDVALDHNIDIEGACGGELACSTCHVIVTKELYDILPTKTEEEEDMLDLALNRTSTSRLCCQIVVNSSIEGAVFTVPAETFPVK